MTGRRTAMQGSFYYSFNLDVSVIEADPSRYHGVAPDELDWTDEQRQKGAVKEYLAASDETPLDLRRKASKVISPSDLASAWTAKVNKRVQFGYGLNDLIDNKSARKICRDVHEAARDKAFKLAGTLAFEQSRDEWKKVEMRFVHLKDHQCFERLRLRGLGGARDELHLAAIVQNFKPLAMRTEPTV